MHATASKASVSRKPVAQAHQLPLDGRPIRVSKVTLYDMNWKPVLAGAEGLLKQTKTAHSFSTQIELLGPQADGRNLQSGARYRAVGLTEQGAPFQSEPVSMTADVNGLLLSGEVHAPRQAKQGAAQDTPDILISFTNYASTSFDLSDWGDNLQLGLGSLTNAPSGNLTANSGQQSLGANQQLSGLDEGPADIWLDFWPFSVWIHFNLQIVGIGPRPDWYVQDANGNWIPNGDDPAYPYTWPDSTGFNAVATPDSGHSSLTVAVLIQDFATA